jgi:hypothetical protein
MNPSESEALSRRVRWLNHRTLAVGIVCIVMLLIALGFAFSTLRELINFFSASQRPTDFAIHIPGGLGQSRSSVIATTLMFAMAMAMIGVWGMSTGSIRRAKCFLAFTVVLVCGIADFYLTSLIHRPIFGLSSQSERAVNAGKYEEAEIIIAAFTQVCMTAMLIVAKTIKSGDMLLFGPFLVFGTIVSLQGVSLKF